MDGKMSTFGGPDDTGVKPGEGLALMDDADVAANPDLFLPNQPPNTSGLARRLKPDAKYLACRWDYAVTPKSFLKTVKVKVSKADGAPAIEARPVDWGPNIDTGRVADLSPGLATALGLNTNNTCHVEIPLPAGAQTPSPGSGVATGVNPAVIDLSIFPADMARQLVVMTTFDNATYWVINQIGPQEGGQSLLRRSGGTNEVLFSDFYGFPNQGKRSNSRDCRGRAEQSVSHHCADSRRAKRQSTGFGRRRKCQNFCRSPGIRRS